MGLLSPRDAPTAVPDGGDSWSGNLAIALQVEDKGFVLTTLRSAAEVRCSAAYFEDIHDSAAPWLSLWGS